MISLATDRFPRPCGPRNDNTNRSPVRFGNDSGDRFERRGPLPYADIWLEALRDDNMPCLQNIIMMGMCDPNEPDHNNRSMMTYAAEYGSPEAVTVIHESGGKLNPENPDNNGTPLLYAVYNDHPMVVPVLLQLGAEPDTPVKGTTPLMLAAMTGNLNALINLHAFGADIDRPHPATGQTPLMLALEADEPQVAAYLATSGADLSATDRRGNGVFHYARGKALNMLLELSAD